VTCPTYKLSQDAHLKSYAEATNSILEIKSMLFQGHIVQFLAMLTDLSYSFDSTWEEEQVFGRNDPIAIFQGTKRSISLGFDVVAGNIRQAQENLGKIDALTSFLYPSYRNLSPSLESGNTTMTTELQQGELQGMTAVRYMNGSPLVKVKFANLLNNNLSGVDQLATVEDPFSQTGTGDGLLGFISGLTVNPKLELGTFTANMKHFPKALSISFNFNVLHQQTPGYDSDGKWLGKSHFFGTLTDETIQRQEEEALAQSVQQFIEDENNFLDNTSLAVSDEDALEPEFPTSDSSDTSPFEP